MKKSERSILVVEHNPGQQDELDKVHSRLENIVEERTIELIEMNSKLQESETNFRNIFNNTRDCFVITDYDFKFLEANNTLLNHFGVTREFLSSQSLMDFLAPAYHNLIIESLQLTIKEIPTSDMEIEVIAPFTQQVIPFEVNNVPIVFNQKKAILTVMRDITERRLLSRRLFETIIQTEEEERSRFARNLHDEIGPLISALKIYTTSFIENNSLEKKDKLAEQMGVIIRDVIESVKNISNDLSPHVLVNFGLLAATNNFLELFSRNLTIKLSSNLALLRFPPIVESLVYRIIKELINNTSKHAQASSVFINLDFFDSALVCHYRDDGIGFHWQQLLKSNSKGMGINNIISRIQSMGGDYEIQSEPGHGFEINFVFKTTLKDAIHK
jgi:PAS domain S-box-containing protein